MITTFELPAAKSPLTFEDRNFPERAGWKEIVIRSDAGVELVRASQGGVDRSKALTAYPADSYLGASRRICVLPSSGKWPHRSYPKLPRPASFRFSSRRRLRP